MLLVSLFTSIDPFRVDIDRFGKVVDCGLEVFEAYAATDPSHVPCSVHFNFARLLMITEWTIELCVQWFNGLSLSWRLSFTLPLGHRLRSI